MKRTPNFKAFPRCTTSQLRRFAGLLSSCASPHGPVQSKNLFANRCKRCILRRHESCSISVSGTLSNTLRRRPIMPIQLPDARQLSDEALQVLRLRALHGIELGYSEVDLAALLGVCNETISRWWTAY